MASQNDTDAPSKLAPTASPSPATPDMQRPGLGKSPDFRDQRPESIGDDIKEPPQLDTSALLESKSQPLDSSHDKDPVAQLFGFLATATPGTLGGVAAGLCAITYLVLGRIGLVLIGAVGGIALFVSYEANHPDFARAVRREKGTDAIQRLMQDLKGPAQETVPGTQEDGEDDQLVRSFDDFRPKTREAMKGFVDAIIRDYVRWWYAPIVPSDRSFSLASRKLLSSFLLSISNHLARKRPADAFLDLLTNSTSMTIVFLSELSAAFAELPPDSSVTSIDAVYNYLASHPDSNLASLMNQRQQASKFHMVAEDILGYLDQSAQNCDVVKVFTREMIANVLLGSTLQTCSQPEWINGWIVYLLEAGEPDISQAIDVGMQTGRDANPGVLPDPDNGIGSPVPATKVGPSEGESDGMRKREPPVSNHRKKLSKADEEMEEAIEEMKRLNQMIAEEENKRVCHRLDIDGTAENGSRAVKPALIETTGLGASDASETTSPRPRPSSDKASFKATSTDSRSSTGEIIHTPVTPGSAAESRSQGSSPKQASNHPFTNFDQIVPKESESLDDSGEPRKSPFTLHNATIMIHDESGGENGRIWSKPYWDYLLQIEPVSSDFPGWMIVRKYVDFETLHEVLRRIANISGATAFTEKHGTLPLWKEHTRESLREELEGYLKDACRYQNLAECEGMKRFLDKDQGIPQGGENRYSFGFDALGKNVLDVLTTAPKGAMQGSQAVFDGVTGVLGNFGLGQRKSAPVPAAKDPHPAALSRLSMSSAPRVNSMPSPVASQKGRDSMDSQRSSVVFTQPGKIAPMERRPSSQFERDSENEGGSRSRSERFDSSPRGSNNPSRASSRPPTRSHSSMSLDGFNLPPIPSEVGDDYEPRPAHHRRTKTTENLAAPSHLPATSPLATTPPITAPQGPTSPPKRSRQYTPLTEQETSVAVELMFAIINELYTLTSAWNIRRTLLGAAKSFLLRPGNPSLTSIRALIQESVLDANTSDAGIAAALRKLRENSVPTEEELAAWPAVMTQDEKDRLRDKARRLLIQSGVPAALTGVMGQTATSEAVGRVFDCLQIEEVARGLMFGILLQAARVITH